MRFILTIFTAAAVYVTLVVQSSTAARHRHFRKCLSDDQDQDTFIQRMFSDNMRRQSPGVFSIRNSLFCGTSKPDRDALLGHLHALNSTLMTRLTEEDLSLLRFVTSERPIIFRQTREDLAKNLLTVNKDVLCMVEAGDMGNAILGRRTDCAILRHFRKVTRSARAIIGPLGACDPDALQVDCTGWETMGRRTLWLMSYFVVNQIFQFLEFLDHSCVDDFFIPMKELNF